jgi:hypothetical protein
MLSMTRAHLRANWIGPPSLSQPLLAALLRAFAMLVLCAASIVRMRFSLLPGECHTEVEPETLPEQETGNLMETEEAAASRQTATPRQLTCATAAADDDDDFIRVSSELPAADPSGSRPASGSDDDDSVWDFVANPDSRMRADITHA